MAREHKQRQTRASHGLAKPRNPRMCQICGHVVFKIERDHPFRKEHDLDFTINVCPACHYEVTRWDVTLDKHDNRKSLTAAPFLYILHRVQLALTKRGMTSNAIDLQQMEDYLLRPGPLKVNGVRTNARFDNRNDDHLVLIADIATWAKRAAELTIPRLSPDHETVVSVVSDIARDPRQFYEQLLVYMASPDSDALSDRAKALMQLIQENASAVEIHERWQAFSKAMVEATSHGAVK